MDRSRLFNACFFPCGDAGKIRRWLYDTQKRDLLFSPLCSPLYRLPKRGSPALDTALPS